MLRSSVTLKEIPSMEHILPMTKPLSSTARRRAQTRSEKTDVARGLRSQ